MEDIRAIMTYSLAQSSQREGFHVRQCNDSKDNKQKYITNKQEERRQKGEKMGQQEWLRSR